MFKKTLKGIFFLLYLCNNIYAQKELTLQQCVELLQKNNLLLLSEQFNISAAEAAVIQAKIWEQPYLSGELNLINPQNYSYLDVGAQGQKVFAVQQLIYLGGKKKNEINFAKSNVELAKNLFEQLLRNLYFQLKVNFYQLYFNREKHTNLTQQIANLDSLILAYKIQAEKGNIPLKDVVRLQSLAINFKGQLLDLQKEFFENQQNLKILLGINEEIIPQVETDDLNNTFSKSLKKSLPDLEKAALEKNLDLQFQQQVIRNQELYLKWQKSLATPDLTIGSAYDQRGGAFNNQVNLTFGIPLPLWNKNKGNVQIAKYNLEQSKINTQQKEREILSWVQSAYNAFMFNKNQYELNKNYSQNFTSVYYGVLSNFQKRNISLIEFTDFMESYKQSIQFLNDLKLELILSQEKINYLINENEF